MEKNKNIIEHLDDFGKGVYDTFLVTPYNFGDFLGRISGLRDWQNGSVVIKDHYQQEAIEEVKLFWRGIASINNWDRAKILFNLAKNEIKNRPMYYLGSFASSGFMSSAIKTGSKVGDIAAKGTFTTTMTSTKILANIHEFYPSFKTLNNNICSLYSNNKNYTNLFNQDIIMCSFLQNDNQELTPQPQDLQQEKQKFYYNIQKTNTEFNSYKPIPIISFANPKVAYIQKLNPNNIDSLTKDSPIHLLNALYQCEDYILLDENKEAIVNKKSFNYTSSFYLSFLSNQDSVTDEYLEARKSLYKSISQIKQEKQKQELQELQKQQEILEQSLQNLDSKQKESQLKELQREQEKALRDKQRQEQQQARLNKHSNLILESQDKSITIIFLDKLNSNVISSSNNVQFFNNISMSHLLHIHNNKIDIFTKDKTYLDIQELESLLQEYVNTNTESNNTKQDSPISLDILNSPSTQIFLDSTLLTGSSEIQSNPFFFGTPDTKSNIGLDESKPIYHFSPKDEENNLGTLTIFLNSCTLTLLNYSLLDSTLNIKLTLTNKESKEKQDKAIIQNKQKQHKEQLKPLSTAMLHPLLEDNEIKCPHNGVVQLQSNKGKSITDKNIPFILESDLLNSPIIGCTNNIAGVPTPCTQVALILPSSRGLKKHNDDYPIMQDLVSSGVMSDKGFPLICTPKPNSYKINAPSPTHTKNRDKVALKAQIEFHKPILRLHYKIYPSQKDNLPIYRIKLDDSIIESNNDTPLDALNIDIAKDTKTLDTGTLNDSSLDSNLQDILSKIYSSLKQTYAKDYLYQYLSLQLDSNALILILLIPQKIPKLFKEPYKDYEHKDYGIGKYNYLYEYCTFTTLKIADSMQAGLDSYPSNATILTLHTPYKAQRLELQLASGLDSVIESDREQTQQIIDSLLTLQVINGGHEEKHWGFREETENKDTQANPVQTNINTESKDSKATQENKDKQILEIYFSYGDDTTRLQGDSRHTQDVNLHIKTQGYSNGEEVEVLIKTSNNKFNLQGKINNNEAILYDIFKDRYITIGEVEVYV